MPLALATRAARAVLRPRPLRRALSAHSPFAMDAETRTVIEALHASPTQAVLYLAGGGSQVLSLRVSSARRTDAPKRASPGCLLCLAPLPQC